VTQKVIEVIGISDKNFEQAVENAVREASRTLRGLKWARCSEFEMQLDGKKIVSYRANVKIFFDVER
jgi:hypothetical protein